MSAPDSGILKLFGGRWELGNCWRLPERRVDGQVAGWVSWAPGREPESEHGRTRGFVYSPQAVAEAGGESSPLFLVETIDDLGAVHGAGHVGIARPYRSQGYEALAELVGDRRCAGVAAPNALSALSSSALCRHLEKTAQAVLFVPVSPPHPSLSVWLARSTDPEATLALALARAVGAPRLAGGAK